MQSDHESTTAEEAREKLRLGLMVFIREGTVARNLDALVPLVTSTNESRFCFCTDDRQPADLLDEGHIDHLVRRAIRRGLPPVTAIRLASWNAAAHFRLHDRGALTPGRRADLVVFDDLDEPRPRLVFRGGVLMARDGRLVAPARPVPVRSLRGTMNVAWQDLDLRIPAAGRRARVIGLVPNDLVTTALVAELPARDGFAVADPARDLLKLAVIERHRASGATGRAFVQGLGLRRGAIASSIAHDHHNLIVAGADDVSMLAAARRVGERQGGMVAADGEEILAEVPLPLAGLMSLAPVEVVRQQVDAAIAAAHRLGSPLHDPFMAMSFLALEVIPTLKLTDRGLIDAERLELVPLWVEE
jgi:adenine deaminase